MKFITKNTLLTKTLIDAIEKYDKIYIAVAWATCHKTSKILLENSRKIQKLIVGTDREVTSPEFLEKFKNQLGDKLKVIHQSEGLFHPKLYLFTDNEEDEWSLFIGSANFTKNAFSENHESVMLITNEDNITNNILREQFMCLQEYEKIAFSITDEFLENYKFLYNKSKRQSTFYDPYLSASLQELTWKNYKKFIMLRRTNETLWYDERIKLLSKANEYFREIEKSSSRKEGQFISIEKLKALIGLVNERDDIYWHHFGHMRTSNLAVKELQGVINIVNKIPFSGKVTREDYNSYMAIILSIKNIDLSIATRILALKRPDFFFCVTGENTHRFKHDFKYSFNKKSKDDYWKLVNEDLPSCSWYKNNYAMPGALRNSKTAMLDTILYRSNETI
jgi:HKD family nuclease